MFQSLGQSGLIKTTRPALCHLLAGFCLIQLCQQMLMGWAVEEGAASPGPSPGALGRLQLPKARAQQLPWAPATARWLLCFRTGRKHIFLLPCLGNRKHILIKTLPHTDWAGKRWSLATLRFVLQMQTSNYCKVSDRMAGLTNVYSPWCCCFQMYLYLMQTYP